LTKEQPCSLQNICEWWSTDECSMEQSKDFLIQSIYVAEGALDWCLCSAKLVCDSNTRTVKMVNFFWGLISYFVGMKHSA